MPGDIIKDESVASSMRCADCINYQAMSDQGGFCKANPPTPMLVPQAQQGKIATGTQSTSFALQGVFPPVPAGEWCAAFDNGDATDPTVIDTTSP